MVVDILLVGDSGIEMAVLVGRCHPYSRQNGNSPVYKILRPHILRAKFVGMLGTHGPKSLIHPQGHWSHVDDKNRLSTFNKGYS